MDTNRYADDSVIMRIADLKHEGDRKLSSDSETLNEYRFNSIIQAIKGPFLADFEVSCEKDRSSINWIFCFFLATYYPSD